jgi:hypothetical protein
MTKMLVVGAIGALALAACGSNKVITRTTVVAPAKTVTVTNTAPATTSTTIVASTPAATTTTPSASGSLPTIVAGSYTGSRPTTVDFSGDAGNIVTGITWSSWSPAGATGEGTSNIQGCVPNCAQGSETPVPTTISFSDPQDGHFTQVAESRKGFNLSGSSGSTSWPEGAS